MKKVEPFRTVVADPPWKFGDSLPNAKRKVDGKVVYGAGAARGASRLYPTMSTRTIADFLDDEGLDSLIAPDALLFLWRVSAMQEDGLHVMKAWRFAQKSEIVWAKTGTAHVDALLDKIEPKLDRYVNSGGEKGDDHYLRMVVEEARRLAFGMGRYTRGAHETCLIGRRGKAAVRDRSVRSVFFAPVGEHSEKPEEFYRIVEKLSPGPYLELFARKKRPGWTCLGFEVPE